MTRKDYVFFAEILGELYHKVSDTDYVNLLATRMKTHFATDNPNFDSAKFGKAVSKRMNEFTKYVYLPTMSLPKVDSKGRVLVLFGRTFQNPKGDKVTIEHVDSYAYYEDDEAQVKADKLVMAKGFVGYVIPARLRAKLVVGNL